ncbi:MAG: 3-oxoacyl-[acyl-carrier-protein] reductase [Verrucomicrobia bacterium]|jgi:3-oxoacyl-[acyl-carrier protein] reductase|nr:3-oxoacyl-[acyl-carrier-protein] reductase [Verrucomicrobiota bacterium]
MGQLNEKIAVVTGAGRGIGKAIALQFAREGADVVCLSRTAENAEAAAKEVRELGRKAWAFAVDVSSSEATQQAAANILKETGRVDILVNNAGVTRDDLLMRMSDEAWDTVLDTNLKGAFTLCKAFSRPLMKQRSGCIINISSVIGLMGNAGQTNYAASKAGLIGLTKSIARELAARNVTCNAIAPGFIETDMTAELNEDQKQAILNQIPLRQLGQPEDIALAAVYLAGQGGKYVTGQVLTVDGGMVM